MVIQDPVMSLDRLHRGAAGFLLPAQAGPPRARDRADAVHRRHAHHRDHAGSAAGHAHGQGLRARRRDAATARRKRRRGRARIQQDGAGRQPRQSADGNARRLHDRAGDDLRRLPRDRNRRDAGRVRFVHRGVPARLRAGQAPGAAQHRPQQQSGGRARALRGHRQPAGRAER